MKRECGQCQGAGWVEQAENDDGTAAGTILCGACDGYGRRSETSADVARDGDAENGGAQ